MSAGIIDGKAIGTKIRAEIKKKVAENLARNRRAPGLAVVLVGNDPASQVYVNHKRKACKEAGIMSQAFDLPGDTKQDDLAALIHELNNNAEIDGILVQLPLPEHIDTGSIIESIAPDKDVDGFHPYNIGRLAQRIPTLRPCTPFGIIKLLESIQESFKYRNAVIVGASNIVGRPMASELLLKGATVSICHRFTADLASYVQTADILVVAAGKPKLVLGEWVKPGATVIDVGMNRMPNGTLTGDVEFEAAAEKAAWITPVPGGVGPMTVAMLLHNTLQAYQSHCVK